MNENDLFLKHGCRSVAVAEGYDISTLVRVLYNDGILAEHRELPLPRVGIPMTHIPSACERFPDHQFLYLPAADLVTSRLTLALFVGNERTVGEVRDNYPAHFMYVNPEQVIHY